MIYSFNLRTLEGETSRFCEFGSSLVYIMGSRSSRPHSEMCLKKKKKKKHSFNFSSVQSCGEPGKHRAFPEVLMYGEATKFLVEDQKHAWQRPVIRGQGLGMLDLGKDLGNSTLTH